uniref:Uncharacterized protein n=1 Tax=Trichogramma kaykai TaxID=54128 RepID=A0ABD2VWH4_9HYME
MLISRSAAQQRGAFSNLRRLPRIDFSPKSRVLGIALMNYRRSSPRARFKQHFCQKIIIFQLSRASSVMNNNL